LLLTIAYCSWYLGVGGQPFSALSCSTAPTNAATGCGAKRGTSSVKLDATKCTKYLSRSSTRIKCRVPAKARFG